MCVVFLKVRLKSFTGEKQEVFVDDHWFTVTIKAWKTEGPGDSFSLRQTTIISQRSCAGVIRNTHTMCRRDKEIALRQHVETCLPVSILTVVPEQFLHPAG